MIRNPTYLNCKANFDLFPTTKRGNQLQISPYLILAIKIGFKQIAPNPVVSLIIIIKKKNKYFLMIPPHHIHNRHSTGDVYSFLFLSFSGPQESISYRFWMQAGILQEVKTKAEMYTFFLCSPESQSSFSFGFYSFVVGK